MTWDSKKAEMFLRQYANSLVRDAKHIRENLGGDGVHTSEEEFFLFLVQGLGWDEEEAREKTDTFAPEKG